MKYQCQKCNVKINEFNQIEVLGLGKWILCKKCEDFFYEFVESFFVPRQCNDCLTINSLDTTGTICYHCAILTLAKLITKRIK